MKMLSNKINIVVRHQVMFQIRNYMMDGFNLNIWHRLWHNQIHVLVKDQIKENIK